MAKKKKELGDPVAPISDETLEEDLVAIDAAFDAWTSEYPSEDLPEPEPVDRAGLVEVIVSVAHNEYTKGARLLVDADEADRRIASGMFERS